MGVPTYDPACEDLARVFLDEYGEEMADDLSPKLAYVIQRAVEEWLGRLDEAIASGEKVGAWLAEAEKRPVTLYLSMWRGLVHGRPVEPASHHLDCRKAYQIVSEVSQRHAVPIRCIMGPERDRRAVRARQEAMWAIRNLEAPWSYPAIGRFFGRDHTTVMWSVKAHNERIDDARS